MDRFRRSHERTWTASQVVANNLTRARELRRLTQADIAERLTRFTGSSWSAVTVAQAEGSTSGNRVRQFTANEIVALARTFDLPVLYFFLPPEDEANALETGDSPPEGWPWEYLLLLVWGHAGNFPILADRTAPWAHASPLVTIPQDDVLAGTADESLLDRVEQSRERYSPDDMLALAFHGLARRRMRGSMIPGEEVATFADNLRGLANALEAFNNYQPGTFLDADRIRDMGKAKHQRKKKE